MDIVCPLFDSLLVKGYMLHSCPVLLIYLLIFFNPHLDVVYLTTLGFDMSTSVAVTYCRIIIPHGDNTLRLCLDSVSLLTLFKMCLLKRVNSILYTISKLYIGCNRPHIVY